MLNTQRLIRRWQALNPSTSPPDLPPPEAKREQWIDAIVQCLADSHTLGGMDDMSIEIESSPYAVCACVYGVQIHTDDEQDLCVALGGDGFKWRWDACIVPPKLAAEVLSNHLILPLVSTVHLAFTSTEPLGEMPESELEKVRLAETSVRSICLTSLIFRLSTELAAPLDAAWTRI